MDEITTSRDFYCFIGELRRRHGERRMTLESYLSNLQALARARSNATALTLAELAGLLEAAFEPLPGSASAPERKAAEGYAEWDARIGEQIRDLQEMEAAGTLANEHRYFGVNAPSGARWFNFDPCTFIECAAAGTFGGWQEGDDTGRMYVPGPVAVLDADGKLTAKDPREIEEPIVELPGVSWGELVRLLDCGQLYE